MRCAATLDVSVQAGQPVQLAAALQSLDSGLSQRQSLLDLLKKARDSSMAADAVRGRWRTTQSHSQDRKRRYHNVVCWFCLSWLASIEPLEFRTILKDHSA